MTGTWIFTRCPEFVPVYEFIRDHPGCTTREINESLGTALGAHDLQRLRARGLIRTRGRSGNGYFRWVVTG